MLIEIDRPKLHIGEIREADNLLARHSPLAWVIFGAAPTLENAVREVLYVKNTGRVDMSDLWSTEIMGVSVRWCMCANNKLCPIEHKEARVINKS